MSQSRLDYWMDGIFATIGEALCFAFGIARLALIAACVIFTLRCAGVL